MPKMTSLRKNHVQLPPDLRLDLLGPLYLDRLCSACAVLPLLLYRFLVSTLMMSKLSVSSPVMAVKPRYVACGSLRSGTWKQCSHSSSDLYNMLTFSIFSARYVILILVGNCALRRPRACPCQRARRHGWWKNGRSILRARLIYHHAPYRTLCYHLRAWP